MASLADSGRRRRPGSKVLPSPGGERAEAGLPARSRVRWYLHVGDHAPDAFVTSALTAVEAAVTRKRELARRLLAALVEVDALLRQCGAEGNAQGQAERLRRRRRVALRRLPASVRSAHEKALQRGRVPVLAAVDGGACGVCGSRLPPPLAQAIGCGAVMACPGCERLLYTTEAS